MSSQSPLSHFLAQHRATLDLAAPPTAAQTEAAVAVLATANGFGSGGLDVSLALYLVAGTKSWHNDWLLAATAAVVAQRKELQRRSRVEQNRTRDGYVGRLDRREEPTGAEIDADSANWEWAITCFEVLDSRNEVPEEGLSQEERAEEVSISIRDAYGSGDCSSDGAATWFYEHTTMGPYQIEAEFPGLWKETIDTCIEEDHE